MVTIINKVNTVSTPVFWVEADFLPERLNMNPPDTLLSGEENVHAGLRGVTTAADLDAKLSDGTNLVALEVNEQTREAAAKLIQQLVALIDQLPEDGTALESFVGGTKQWGTVQRIDGWEYHEKDNIHQRMISLPAPRTLPGAVPAPAVQPWPPRNLEHCSVFLRRWS